WAAGVNDLWVVDQHDKWKYKFGLALHTGIVPFIGRIQWLKVWWTNSNPRLILSYYLDAVVEAGFMPLVSQSDPRNENYGLANGHTLLRHWHDPRVMGTLQHRWMNEKKNVMPEISWSQMHHRFTPGFEDALDIVTYCRHMYYLSHSSPYYPALSLVFQWVFIPRLQKELDGYHDHLNNTAKHANLNKVLPHSVANHMYEAPEDFGVLDFKIQVDPAAITHVRNLYAPPDHEVFELVPKDFAELAAEFYAQIGHPPITRTNVWDIYLALLSRFQHLDNLHRIPAQLDNERGYTLTLA
ncbi:hypothetical protein B0H10DRAFT_1806111, partial [Mycena sp. CBHHK59/15]